MSNNNNYVPTSDDLVNVIQLLHDNGIVVGNSKAAYEQLKVYESNPSFCILLSKVFDAQQCPVPNLPLTVPWIQYRLLAGLTLKNNIEKAKHALGEPAVREAAQCALQCLKSAVDVKLSRVSAQIIVKVTTLTSFEWWVATGLGDLANILLNELLSAGGLKTLGALFSLQYLMEDMPKQVGEASGSIITRVSQLAVAADTPHDLKKASFRMCFNIFEQSSLLEWNFDNLSPLQRGLVSSSWHLACVCTTLIEQSCNNDIAFMSLVLRTCSFLLDYFDYFVQLDHAAQQKLGLNWIVKPIDIIGGTRNDSSETRELLSASIELLTFVVDINEREVGEGHMAFFASIVESNIERLLRSLVLFSPLSEEEVANIVTSDDYLIRDSVGVRNEGGKDIGEDAMLDDEETAMTLRRSALKCISSLCVLTSSKASTVMLEVIQAFWNSSEWRDREAGAVLIGTIASGCGSELEPYLPTICEQLIHLSKNASENICVSSISFWSLSQLYDMILATSPPTFHVIISTITSRVQSTSKRIQLTACSALNTAFMSFHDHSDATPLMQHCSEILHAACGCLSVYNTRNLSCLIQLLCHCILYLDDVNKLHHLVALLKDERGRRAQLFEETYTKVYISNEANALIDKDVFSLDTAILVIQAKCPDFDYCMQSLNMWNAVLADAISRDAKDDADLLSGIFNASLGYCKSIPSSKLKEWVVSTSWSLPTAGYTALINYESTSVRRAVVNFLNSLIQILGSEAFPTGMHDAVLSTIPNFMEEEDDSQMKQLYVQLICFTVVYSPSQPNDVALKALSAANSALRLDVYGDSSVFFSQMAFHLCRSLEMYPQLAQGLNVATIAELISRSEHSFEKSEATVRLCNAMYSASSLESFIPAFLNLVISWNEIAFSFPGTVEAMKLIMRRLTTEWQQQTNALVSNFPPPIRSMILSMYS
ncbi:transportin2-like protein [Strigomonas culicis]|uniref:Transportin2-like protein n=1 Tax=Strigomonas culicis TaxID=28005 RepID=S9TPE7_9TRYP|nr:transportin2-like protein [Strigomonas culicis]EPY23396.1 transportin2-like protein [Strigomonas culicis]|eukprot:EPY20142.1 transportin2-like protein [Strigomonas culicis]